MTERIHSPDRAAELIRSGGLVAFPTETVFGLGADASNREAIERLFVAKGRPSDNPLIVHISHQRDWGLAASSMPPAAEALFAAFSPGPLTLVLPKRPSIDPLVTAGLDSVGIRIPDHPVAQKILQLSGVPVAAPSANRSGRPSGTTWRSVLDDLDNRIDGVFCEDSTRIGIESTVVDCCGATPQLLRLGAITLRELRQVVPEIEEANRCSSNSQNEPVKSPGLLHAHYQPRANVHVVEHPICHEFDPPTAYCGLEEFEGMRTLSLWKVYPSVEAYAAGFYEFLREADRKNIPTVYVQLAPDQGIGQALRDRQHRAAARNE